ncbi:MAG: sugar transferase [Candidatus Dormibacteraeota bacterium]|nr:sugar transferase [Candidatus Dormibacteraeota bacterium]
MPKPGWALLRVCLVLADLATYLGALILAARPLGVDLRTPPHSALALLTLPMITIIFAAEGLYDPQNLLGGTREYAGVLRACTYALVGLIAISFAVHLPVSTDWAVEAWLLSVVLIGSVRFGLRRVFYRMRRLGLFVSRVLLVGADAHGVAVVRQLTQPPSGIQVVGVLDDYLPIGTLVMGRLRVVGSSEELSRVAALTGAREVILVPQALPWESVQRVLATMASSPSGVRVHLLASFQDLLTAGVRISARNGIPLLTVKDAALTPTEAALKRAFDCTLAVALLVLLAPPMAVELLRLHHRGAPLLEKRRVLGQQGEAFDLLSLPCRFAVRSELLRKLPSLLNVLAGQLTIVGPRPIPATGEGARLQGHSFAVRPGLTGLWRQATDSNEQALLDLCYIRGYSPWLDMHILLERVKSRLRTRGATVDALDGGSVAS